MYLVCRPCSSSPSPSTSSLYLGLMTTMMSTDFCRMTSHCQLLQETKIARWIKFCSDSIVRLTSLRYLSIHLVMPILRSGLSNMSICKEKDRVWMVVWRVTQKQRWWRHEKKTHCRFKSLISQKFGKRNHFSSYVHRICDENVSCQQKVSITSLIKPITFYKNMKRSLQTHF